MMANGSKSPWGAGTGINSLADMIRGMLNKDAPLQTSALSEMVKGSSPFAPPVEGPSGLSLLNPKMTTGENDDIFRPAYLGGSENLKDLMVPPPGPQAIPPTVQEPFLSPGMTKGLDSLGPILAAAGLLYATQRGTGQRPAPVGRTGGGTMNWPMPSELLAKLTMANRRG
jgi:hypothetical protein